MAEVLDNTKEEENLVEVREQVVGHPFQLIVLSSITNMKEQSEGVFSFNFVFFRIRKRWRWDMKAKLKAKSMHTILGETS